MFIEFIKENKKLIIIIIIFIILLILFNIFTEVKDKNKIDNSENYVYTYKEKNNSQLPYINLYSEDILNINLSNLEKYLIIEKQQTGTMTYKYYQSNNILSLLVHTLDTEGNIEITTYNINISEKTELSNNELLNKFSLTENSIDTIIENNLKKYYQYEKEHKYINNDCNYTCYKQMSQINYTNDYQLYVKNNELYIYKKFQVTPNFLYDKNNPFTLFHFKLS